MTLGELFDLCQDIELRQAKLYAALSLLLGDVDERVARFWEQMSMQEWQHHILVDFGRSVCINAFGIDSPVTALGDIPVQQITDALDAHEHRVNSGNISLDEAFEIAIAIEGSEADAVYMHLLSMMRKAIEQSNQPYLMDRIVQVEKDMVSHVQGLVKAAQRFAKDPALIRKAHRLEAEHG